MGSLQTASAGDITTATFAGRPFPALIADGGRDAIRRFIEFFTANINNANTRVAYANAIGQFCAWADGQGHSLKTLHPVLIAAYVEELKKRVATASVKQHLAAIRMLFDWLVLGQIVRFNPAASVRGPKHVVRRGKTPVLNAEEARGLLDAIDVTTIAGLRDRALLGVMLYTFARVSAAVAMKVEDYYSIGRRGFIRLTEKGGKFRELPAHHNAALYLDEYIDAAELAAAPATPLFRSMRGRSSVLSDVRLTRTDALRMIKRRAAAVKLPAKICCHTFRGTGITNYLANGGTIEKAQFIAGHESPETTKLYDRTEDEVTLDEIERIAI